MAICTQASCGFWINVGCFIYNFQTLLAGIAAIIVGTIAVIPVWGQLKDTNLQARISHRETLANLLRAALRRYERVDKEVREPLNAANRVVYDPEGEPEEIGTEVFFLPAAAHVEKDGTFTNTQRLLQWHHKAVDPPGEAKSDMAIMIDFADRMGFKDKDGNPLIKWRTPEEAFEAWKVCSAGRPCDYTGITYAKLTGGSGVQWPCNENAPDGTERLYADYHFPTAWDECGDFGHDIETGAARTKEEYKAEDPEGRAILKAERRTSRRARRIRTSWSASTSRSPTCSRADSDGRRSSCSSPSRRSISRWHAATPTSA